MNGRYDPDELIARMRTDRQSDWPWKLLRSIARRPLVDESMIGFAAPARTGALSPSETKVLEAASRGLTAEMSAQMLGIAYETVRSELMSARRRLRAKNTVHACCEAIRLGLIR